MNDCIFCKIANKEISSEFLYEDDDYFVVRDIFPEAKTHLLIITKKHIETVNDLENNEKELVGGMILLASRISKELGIVGYKLKFNVGKEGGQEIFHLHLHLLAN